jgi:hypothetical protein
MASRLARLFRSRAPAPGLPRQQAGGDRWQALPHPVSGHSTADSLPVPVVAVRRHGPSGQLEVVRGHHPTPEWPGADPPRTARRYVISAASFNPHPRRELTIGDGRFVFATLPNSVRCRSCGAGDMGFGFVASEAPPAGTRRSAVGLRSLCEPCAERQAQVALP